MHPSRVFPRAYDIETQRAIDRRFRAVEVSGPLMKLGRPFTPAELRARISVGQRGPQGPGARPRAAAGARRARRVIVDSDSD